MSDTPVRVLYLDDDEALARLVQKALGRVGFEVTHADTTSAAIARIARGDIDVLALDHYLSDGTGLDFLARLSAAGVRIPVVYVTGTSEMNVAVAALKAGASDFVPKTVGDDFLVLLRAALRQAIERDRLRLEKERAEADVRAARDRAELFLSEMNHRIANSLALVASLVSLQSNAVEDQSAKDALAETQGRILAIALVHRRLYSAGEVGQVALDEYLAGLVENLSVSSKREGNNTRLMHDLAPLRVDTDAGVRIGIVTTEWITNAFKYAYGDGDGEIRVSLRRRPDGLGELVVEDDGMGMDSPPVTRGTGLGTRIVKAMAMAMSGEIDYADRAPGTTARLTFPCLASDERTPR